MPEAKPALNVEEFCLRAEFPYDCPFGRQPDAPDCPHGWYSNNKGVRNSMLNFTLTL